MVCPIANPPQITAQRTDYGSSPQDYQSGYSKSSIHAPLSIFQTFIPGAPSRVSVSFVHSFPAVVTSAAAQPRELDVQSPGQEGNINEDVFSKSRDPIKYYPPAKAPRSRKRSTGSAKDYNIPRLDTVSDREKIDYKGEVQRRNLGSCPKSLIENMVCNPRISSQWAGCF